MKRQLLGIYRRLFARFGAQRWWPAETEFEIVVGAILTQNTTWTNVERAISNLRRARLLTPGAMHRVSTAQLAQLIRPSGYFNLKAKKLHAFTRFLFVQHHGKLLHLFKQDVTALREELLGVYGIGPETADSIILYAARQPIFVIDAYTRRVFARLGLAYENATYAWLQDVFMAHLPHDEQMYNEYHALIVALGKNLCRKREPKCGECPLRERCPTGQKQNRTRTSHALSEVEGANEGG